MSKPLTIKQLKYVDALVRFGNKREAVLTAGYHAKTRKMADGFVSYLNNNPQVQVAIRQKLEMAELTPKLIARRWVEALEGGSKANGTHADYLHTLEAVSRMYGFFK